MDQYKLKEVRQFLFAMFVTVVVDVTILHKLKMQDWAIRNYQCLKLLEKVCTASFGKEQ